MLSVNPKWCKLIAIGKKTVEVRKTKPKLDTPFKCYIYCTQNGDYVYRTRLDENRVEHAEVWNGKVIGEFVCDNIELINIEQTNCLSKACKDIDKFKNNSCLSSYDLFVYLKCKNGYAWHISDLVIYDKPKELGKFKKINRECWYADLGLAKRDCPECKNEKCFLAKPPQSWSYVEELSI